MATGYIILTLTFMSVVYTALSLLPLSTWIKYDQVTVFEPVEAGGPIEMLSVLHRYRSVDMIYNDVLFCDLGDGRGFRLYSPQDGRYSNAPKSKETIVSNWVYTQPVPRKKSTCFIKSAPTVELKYGIRPKPQELKTYLFQVGEPND